MLLWIWTRNDGSGLLDDEFRDGDVFQTKPDSFEPSIGSQEKKSWLIVKIPDPPNANRVEEEIVRSEYAPGPTLGDDPVVRRARIYRLDWRQKFAAADIDIIKDQTQTLPDGPNVTNGVVHGLFKIGDCSRK